MDVVTYRIPATSANLGPGYDCLGIALHLYNYVTVQRADTPDYSHSMTREVADIFFKTAKISSFPFTWKIKGDVPTSRGLGSSVTVRLGILHGLNALCDASLNNHILYDLCATLEGHPDNAAPAAFGGFVVAGKDHKFLRFEIKPGIHFVLLIPNKEMLTEDLRGVLPSLIPHSDAAQNIANACRITAAFATCDYALLQGAFNDFLHQPYRQKFLPCLPDVIRAGVEAGALGGFLSGSGSCIACVTLENPEKVANAMLKACDLPAVTQILKPDNEGVLPV